MKPRTPDSSADVGVQTFSDLFAKASHPLAIDTYQRPFVWSDDKVGQLIADLAEYLSHGTKQPNYYMGTVLLHESTKLFIIDGQQRLTSLCILHQVLKGNLPDNCELSYRNPESATNIRAAVRKFREAPFPAGASAIFDRICVTVIRVQSEDLAFTFFDTQNNRGVPLNATDLLKAYHLRAITGNNGEYERLQKNCAERWERLQRTPTVLWGGADFAPELFHHFLWRARCWTGKRVQLLESNDEILAEFQTGAVSAEESNTVPLYACHQNRFGRALTILPQDGLSLTPEPVRLSNQAAALPFAIRQPISKGVGFFLYADKYADLIRQLMDNAERDPEVSEFLNLYKNVVPHLGIYLKELFLLACVVHVDQFGYKGLWRFAMSLEYVLGAIRLQKYSVREPAARRLLHGEERNLLDVIAGAFRPDDVIRYLLSIPWVNAVYEKEDADLNPARLRYKASILTYCGNLEALSHKRRWLSQNARSFSLS